MTIISNPKASPGIHIIGERLVNRGATMKATEGMVNRAAESVGTWMFIALTIVIGPVGFVLLCGLAYAMYSSNLALGIIIALLASSPLLLPAVWIPLMGASVIEGIAERRADLASESSAT